MNDAPNGGSGKKKLKKLGSEPNKSWSPMNNINNNGGSGRACPSPMEFMADGVAEEASARRKKARAQKRREKALEKERPVDGVSPNDSRSNGRNKNNRNHNNSGKSITGGGGFDFAPSDEFGNNGGLEGFDDTGFFSSDRETTNLGDRVQLMSVSSPDPMNQQQLQQQLKTMVPEHLRNQFDEGGDYDTNGGGHRSGPADFRTTVDYDNDLRSPPVERKSNKRDKKHQNISPLDNSPPNDAALSNLSPREAKALKKDAKRRKKQGKASHIIQQAIRSKLARVKVKKLKRKRLFKMAAKSKVLLACDGTVQGGTGWYQQNEDSIPVYYEVNDAGEWKLIM
jgi:hypothetical protein